MDERDARLVLLARAFEEADADGRLLPPAAREQATRIARERARGEARAPVRARLLLEPVVRALPGVERVASVRLPPGWAPLVVALALVLGMGTNALGPARHVSVLSFPLLGLFVWNLLVYLALLLWPLAARRARDDGADASVRVDGGPGSGLLLGMADRVARRVRVDDPELAPIASRALGAYARHWRAAFGPIVQARGRLILHLGAAALVAGAVLGMYVRGLTFEYRATWSSTFLDAGQAAALLRAVLGPAALLLGEPLPDAARLQAMRAPSDAPAAAWIHMYAVMAGLVVVAPRLLLAAGSARRAVRLRARLGEAVLGGAFRVLGDERQGSGVRVSVAPYSYHPDERALSNLRELVHDAFGVRADVALHPPLEYGEPCDRVRGETIDLEGGPQHVVLVFGLTQSPEADVHGRLVAEVQLRLGPRDRLLCLADASRWRERFGEDDEGRLEERRRAWDRVLREAGVGALHLDLARPLDARVLDGVAAVLWPSELVA